MNSVIPKTEGFKTTEHGAPNTIKKVAELQTYIVGYTDGEGREQKRIAFVLPDEDGKPTATFMLQERIQGTNVATPVHSWFHKALMSKLKGPEKIESV